MANGEVIGFLDADYKTAIDEVAKVLPWLHDGYDVVIGSRRQPGSRIDVAQPWYRRIGSRVFAVGMHAVVGLHEIHDTQCGFKFLKRTPALEIFRRTKIDGYMCDVEILWLAQRFGYRIKEVGIRWRDDGDTRSNLIRSNARSSLDLLRIRFQRYRPLQKPKATRPVR